MWLTGMDPTFDCADHWAHIRMDWTMRSRSALSLILVALVMAAGAWILHKPDSLASPTAALTPAIGANAALAAAPAAIALSTPAPAAAAIPDTATMPERSSTATPSANDSATQPGQATAGTDADAKAPTLAELDRRARQGQPGAARELAMALDECMGALVSFKPDPYDQLSAFGRSSELQQSQARREFYLGARADECRALFNDPDPRINQRNWYEAVLAAWARAVSTGDPFARIIAALSSRQQWPPPAAELAQMRDWSLAHLDARRPQTLVDLAEVSSVISPIDSESAWRLVACDLGYDCRPDGALARSLCLQGRGCFTGTYEEYLLGRVSPRQWEIIQTQRAELLRHLRSGNLASVIQVLPGDG